MSIALVIVLIVVGSLAVAALVGWAIHGIHQSRRESYGGDK